MMARGLRQRFSDERGTAVLEFALIGMILIVLLFGMWDFGRLFDAWLVSTNAAREGARYGAIYGADKNMSEADVVLQVQQKVVDYVQAGFGSRSDVVPYSVGNVTVVFPDGRAIGQSVQVTVAIDVEVWPLIRDMFFSGADFATLQSRATMRI